jgi:hypothetical protein
MTVLDYLWIIAGFVGSWVFFDVFRAALRVTVPTIYKVTVGLIGALTAFTIVS